MNDNLPRQVPGRGGKFELKAVFCQALGIFRRISGRIAVGVLVTVREQGAAPCEGKNCSQRQYRERGRM